MPRSPWWARRPLLGARLGRDRSRAVVGPLPHGELCGVVDRVGAIAKATGGFKAVGKTADSALQIFKAVKAYEGAGAFGAEIEVVPSEVAAEISKQTGKQIPYVNLPEAEYAEKLKSFGVPEGFAHAIAGWDVSASRGDLFDNQHQLSNLIGRPTTSLSVSVKRGLEAK